VRARWGTKEGDSRVPEAKDRHFRFTETGLGAWVSKREAGHDTGVRMWDQSLAVKETKSWGGKRC